jgi:Uncharacterised protein family UPF0547.
VESAKLHLNALLWVAGLIGAISTIAGLFKGDPVYILTAAGYVGMAALLPACIVGGIGVSPERQLPAAIGCIAFGVVALLLGGLRRDETASFNLLSALGIAVIVGVFLLTVSAYNEWQKQQAPAHKTCPDCANVILDAARVCEHCGYRFVPRT